MIYAILFLSALGFAVTDFLARKFLGATGLHWGVVRELWFWLYILFRIIATGVFMYTLSQAELGKTIMAFSMIALVVSVLMGVLFLGEKLGTPHLFSLALAISSILVLIIWAK